jgi:hypothetical protein
MAMLERNEKGKQAGRYFIECEKRLRNMPPTPALDFSDRLSMLKLIQETTQEAIVAEEGRLIALAEVKELTEEVAAKSAEKEELQQQFNLIASKVDVGERCVTLKQFFKETEAELGFTAKTGSLFIGRQVIFQHLMFLPLRVRIGVSSLAGLNQRNQIHKKALGPQGEFAGVLEKRCDVLLRLVEADASKSFLQAFPETGRVELRFKWPIP